MNYCEQINVTGLVIMFFWGGIFGWFADKAWQVLRRVLDL